jgi:XrtN system VIT domain protein
MSPETLLAPKSRTRYSQLIFTSPIWKDPIYATGLIMLGASLIIYHIGGIFPAANNNDKFGSFTLNYLLTVVYFVILAASGRLKRGRNGIHQLFLFFMLFLISAYALNRVIPIFEKSVPWFSVIEVIVCINYIGFIFFDSLSQPLKVFLAFVAGVAMVVFAYLAMYLFPIYIFGVAGFFALGISLHTFVPLLFCIYTSKLIRKQNTAEKNYWKPFIAGIAVPVVLIAAYAINWSVQQNKINTAYRKSDLHSNHQLPSWVNIAREMPNTATAEKIIKTKLVYDVPDLNNFNFFWNVPRLNFEKVYHDPLVMISALFSGPVNVPDDELISILKSIYNARHETQERLWSGQNLITEQLNTGVKLWPDLRIGYTELEVTTSNIPGPDTWPLDEEAIYTFHLPEGGVVTSLSLWISGREEKGILTTKAKADSAYKTIVGGERRDPSVVHWQEGNTVSVRVFPVPRGKSRKFKLGITAPLAYDGKNLLYKNIHLDGPSINEVQQIISVDLGSNNAEADYPHNFSRAGNVVSKTGKFSRDWSISMPTPELSDASFTFKDYAYGISAITAVTQSFSPAKVYLDINSSWTIEECERIYSLCERKEVFVDNNGALTKLNPNNRNRIFSALTNNNFSLFPFSELNNSEQTLVISKSTEQSPTIDELRDSEFFTETNNALQKNKNIYLFNLGTELSPYLKSLRELRAFHYYRADEDKLKTFLERNQFIVAPENDEAISVHSAGIQITRKNASIPGKAPDHLMRLYAYNHVLQRAGLNVLNDKLDDTTLMEEAAEANIVSPFSSLVVLETQADYDRFDIKASKNSLENASLKSKGAVPEPHEWALIVLVLLLLAVLKFRPQFLLIHRK